jgi:hypothetical protein
MINVSKSCPPKPQNNVTFVCKFIMSGFSHKEGYSDMVVDKHIPFDTSCHKSMICFDP